MSEKLQQLYHGIILQHNDAPRHFEKRPEALYVVEAFNPLCGDKFKIFLDVEHGTIVRATFHGYGCAVSKASTSVLMTKIQGQSLETVKTEIVAFLAALGSPQAPAASVDEATAAFLPAKDFPGRLKCATLAWEALEGFVKRL